MGLQRCTRLCHAVAGICCAMDAGLAELLDSPEGDVPGFGGCVLCGVDARRGAVAIAVGADDVVGPVQLLDTRGASAGSPESCRGRVV